MKKIKELSGRLASQIAAGEVIERPASVVKELLENAIDAKSTQINILVEEAGLKRIQVIDNGGGIGQEDVENAFKRHATSKIYSRDDLFRIRTLGFRGEALPSIASISEIKLETAVSNETYGSYLYLKGGKIEERHLIPLRIGTKITVENLFFNTPARLKYVKTLQTELSKIVDIVNRMALSHPNIAFHLIHDNHNMMETSGRGDLKQTIAGIYGIVVAKKMVKVEAQDLDFILNGYVSLPEVTRASRNYLSVIINKRYIKNYALNRAIINGYHSKLMVGRYPIAVLEIQMDPLLVDVNVHPTKQEVRLSKEKELVELISYGVDKSLHHTSLIPSVDASLVFRRKLEEFNTEQLNLPLEGKVKKKGDLEYDPKTGIFYGKSQFKEEAEQKPSVLSGQIIDDIQKETNNLSISKSSQTKGEDICDKKVYVSHPEFNLSTRHGERAIEQAVARLGQEPKEKHLPMMEYFGQMHGTYLFAQSSDGLYIIDQHAAQERVKYEYFREKLGNVSDNLHEFLVPLVLDYPNSDFIKLKEQIHLLQKVGIFLEEFGHNGFIVRSHPKWYPEGQEENIIREMIDMLLVTGSVNIKKFREVIAIMMSCRRSIKANHYLNAVQARSLLRDLNQCENPFNCPHGCPIVIHFSDSDIERLFKRIQDPH
ncbi:DNA mismatch repair endonuclease MutL [Enterococcus faecalis]|uniref:DNA mismatch repair endonuclease MutL n=1 Tax=Enterococcus faecalis TaxID=1351 RepID=UPI003CC5EEA5